VKPTVKLDQITGRITPIFVSVIDLCVVTHGGIPNPSLANDVDHDGGDRSDDYENHQGDYNGSFRMAL